MVVLNIGNNGHHLRRLRINMKKRNNKFNNKRKILEQSDEIILKCEQLSSSVKYGGNPEHKRNPGDFGLTPPSSPRPGKSLCDTIDIYTRKEALKLLKNGLKKGLVSKQFTGEWPQNIWSMTKDGIPLEAQLENSGNGTYHGYPMPESDPLSREVIQQWKDRHVV